MEMPTQNRHYSGRGQPPARLLWFQLAPRISGRSPPKGWFWQSNDNRWRLENLSTGESLDGYFIH